MLSLALGALGLPLVGLLLVPLAALVPPAGVLMVFPLVVVRVVGPPAAGAARASLAVALALAASQRPAAPIALAIVVGLDGGRLRVMLRAAVVSIVRSTDGAALGLGAALAVAIMAS